MSIEKKIQIVKYPGTDGKQLFQSILAVRQKRDSEVSTIAQNIIDEVRHKGDEALFAFSKKFDKFNLTSSNLKISAKEINTQAGKIKPALKAAIDLSSERITAYHEKQCRKGFALKTPEGTLRQMIRPLNRVGLYVPGGHTVYPSTVLMNVIPAQIAGVNEIVVITPPRDELDPGIAYALKHLGISEVYRVGGAQGIAALAYGTATIKPVDKITGPGNSFVAAAKRLVYGIVDIDSVAGPSEVAILADSSVDPSWVAADLLAQAEHGTGDEVAICITEDKNFAESIAAQVTVAIENSPVKDTILRLPEHALSIFVTPNRKKSLELVNTFAAEHLQIMTSTPEEDLQEVTNAAAIFLGPYSPVALGDYFIGTNHVLPTAGTARFWSPLGVESFQKRISVAKVSAKGLDNAAPFVSTFARAEQFIHHALSVECRS
ncbi:MAG TPA: histidinol dehydrogenase [Chitinispirillaceae bacterium]|nr:histidinol dehydrogenase [Chitinispirillaceae bacterium]